MTDGAVAAMVRHADEKGSSEQNGPVNVYLTI